MPPLSVLMPCYNVAATLHATLESLATQTFVDFEIVAVDDGSTDATVDLLETWANSEPRLRLMRCPHLGIIEALNAGLAECRAPLVARMDADDLAHPRRFELQLDYMQQNPDLGLVACLVKGFPEEDLREGFRNYIAWLNSLVADEEIKGERFVESPLAHPSVVFRKDIIREAGGYQEHGWP